MPWQGLPFFTEEKKHHDGAETFSGIDMECTSLMKSKKNTFAGVLSSNMEWGSYDFLQKMMTGIKLFSAKENDGIDDFIYYDIWRQMP